MPLDAGKREVAEAKVRTWRKEDNLPAVGFR
jgi:hypothetical protein